MMIHFSDFLLVFFFAEGEVALLALVDDFGDGWALKKVLHFALIVKISAVVSFFIVELHCFLRGQWGTV